MKTSTKNQAFTIAELLISLGLMAALLASVAVAMKASLMSYTENDEMASITQTARATLSKMARDIRTAEDVSSTATCLTIRPVLDSSGVTWIKYEFLANTLYFRRTVGGVETSYELLGSTDRVKLSSFSAASVVEQRQDADGNSYTVTVAMTMTLSFQIDGQSFTVTATGAPRRNQLY